MIPTAPPIALDRLPNKTAHVISAAGHYRASLPALVAQRSVPKNGGHFEVHCSGVIAKSLKQIQKQAKQEGPGEQVLAAIQSIWHELSHDPTEFGEPLYHLPALQLQVQHGAAGPLLVYFAVMSTDRMFSSNW